jgi:hypothetical protein
MKHPDPVFRRAARIIRMAHELHKIGYQRLRIFPHMSSSGAYWRCLIAPAMLFHRDDGTRLADYGDTPLIARYSTADDNTFFGWVDARKDDAFALSQKFVSRFNAASEYGHGKDHAYADWFLSVLRASEEGFLPVYLSPEVSLSAGESVPLMDRRPCEWPPLKMAVIPPPPGGEYQEDYWNRVEKFT